MKLRSLLKKIIYYISVPKCVCCGAKLDHGDRGLCTECKKIYDEHKERNCPRCAKVLSNCSCPSDYLAEHGVKQLVKLFRYSKQEQAIASNSMIYSLKQDNRADVIEFLAEELSDAISHSLNISSDKFVITNVPRRKSAIVEYGFDHAAQLAQAVAKNLGVEYMLVLTSLSKNPQKSVIGEGRVMNAKFNYKGKPPELKGKTVIIIDDIVTTGASMANCAALIRKCGAGKIIGAVIGIAYKDSYVKITNHYSAF